MSARKPVNCTECLRRLPSVSPHWIRHTDYRGHAVFVFESGRIALCLTAGAEPKP